MVDDRLWELIAPQPPSRGPGGSPRIGDRAALEGILFVLHTGCGAVGGTCPWNWGADPVTPPGAGCARGRRPGCGRSCTGPCSRSSPSRRSSTGPGPASTRCPYGPIGGAS
ncbi:MAG TPA: hypothetical protein DCL70_01590 [Kocuria sp.]|nr:hypothetical protein [Kocuria sp.]